MLLVLIMTYNQPHLSLQVSPTSLAPLEVPNFPPRLRDFPPLCLRESPIEWSQSREKKVFCFLLEGEDFYNRCMYYYIVILFEKMEGTKIPQKKCEDLRHATFITHLSPLQLILPLNSSRGVKVIPWRSRCQNDNDSVALFRFVEASEPSSASIGKRCASFFQLEKVMNSRSSGLAAQPVLVEMGKLVPEI